MAPAKDTMSVLHAWGSQGHALSLMEQQHARFLDSAHLLYPVGCNIAVRNVHSPSDSYFLKQAQNGVDAITSFCVSPDRTLVLSCETTTAGSSSGGQVSVYNLAANNSFTPTSTTNLGLNVRRSGYTAVAVDVNHSRVALLTPQWEDPASAFSARIGTHFQLCQIQPSLALTMLTQTTFPGEICNVAFAPYDSNLTLLVGKGGFVKLYKYNAHSGDLRSFPDFEGSIDPAAHFLTCVFYGPTPGRKEEEDPGGSKSAQRTALLQRLWAKQREVLVLNQAKQEIWMLDSQTLKIVDVMGECFDHTLSAAVRPMALATFQKGFIVGGSDGYLAIWERLDAHSYRFVRNLYTGRRSDLVSVDVVVDDDLFFGKAQEPSSGAGSSGTSSQAGVVLVFADGDMCYVNLAELYLAKDKIDFPASRSLAAHTGPIVAMSATASDLRPYFLTCAGGKEDSSLRIYNHETLELELSAFFSTEKAPVSAALHPDGFSCAVVFSDGSLRLFHLLATRLQVFFETRLPNLRKVAYSPTGHMLAVVHGKVVQIHDSVNMQKLTTLRKHSCNVADICFDFSGTSLATITVDGCFSVWSLTTFTRVAEYLCEPHKDSQDGNVLLNADDPATRAVQTRNIMSLYEQFAASIAFDGDITKGRHRWVVALNFKTVSTKETVGKMFGRLYDLYLVPPRNAETQDLPNDLELHCKLELPDQVYLTSLSFDRSLQSISRDDHHHPVVPVADRYGGSTLYATTIRGSVWVYPHPISLDTDYEELQLHSTRRKTARAQGPTLSLLLFPGKKMLTGSMDGSLFLVQIGAPASKLPRGDDVCLVEKQELQKFEDKIDKLRHDLDSAKTESVQKLDQLKYAYEARLESNKLKSEKSEVEALKERIAMLEDILQEREQEPVRMVKALEAQHIAAQEQLEGMYASKLQMENDRFTLLTKDMHQTQQQAAADLRDSKESAEKERDEVEGKLRGEIFVKDEEIAKYKALIKYVEQRYNQILRDEETDRDVEIEGLMDSATKNLQESQFRVNAMKKEQDTLLRGLNSMEKERQKFALLQKEQEQKVQKMEKDAQRVAGQMDGLRQEIGDLEKLSRKKDKQISDLQQSIEKVERHKSAMEAELKFLNERIQPKDSKIQELSGHLADAGREFVHKLKAEQSRDKQVEALKITIQHQTEAIKQSTRDKEDKDKYIQKFQRELYHAAHDTNEPKAALLTLRRMYQAYSGLYKGDEGGRMPSSGADEAEAVGVVEMDRQKRQLSRSLKKLSAKSDQQSEMGRVNNMRKIGENSLLIQEINELRKGQKNYLDKIKQLELMVKSLREGAAAPPRSSSAPRMPPISAGAATVQPSGLGTKAGLPNARAKAQLQEFASADGFPLMISMQNQR